jgi:septal ring factor EnvC (AmiA/AmiB activator)
MAENAEVMQNELAIPPAGTPIVLGVTKMKLAALKKKYESVPDATTPEGYEAIAEAKRELVPLRTGVIKEAGIQKEAAQLHIKNINAVMNHIVETIQGIEAPLYVAKKAVDDAEAARKAKAIADEEARVSALQAKVNAIQALTANLLNAPLSKLLDRQDVADRILINSHEFGEFLEPASIILGQVKSQLNAAIVNARAFEEQQTQIKAQQAAMAEQAAKMAEQQAKLDKQAADIAAAEAKTAREKQAVIDAEAIIKQREEAAQKQAEAIKPEQTSKAAVVEAVQAASPVLAALGTVKIEPFVVSDVMVEFSVWWNDIGSGIAPMMGDDFETFGQRIASFAYRAGYESNG